MHVTMISTLLHGNVAANTSRRAHAACPSAKKKQTHLRAACTDGTGKHMCQTAADELHLSPLRLIDLTVPSSFTTPKPSSSSLASMSARMALGC